MPLSPLTQQRLARGRAHFNSGRYFEAHEAWEEAWLVETGAVRQALHGLIQIAAALLKASRSERPRGCRLLLEWGLAKLDGLPDSSCGFSLGRLRSRIRAFRELAESWQRGESAAPPASAFPKLFRTSRRPRQTRRARKRRIRRLSVS